MRPFVEQQKLIIRKFYPITKCCMHCANADGEVSPDEEAWILGAALECGVLEHELETIKNQRHSDLHKAIEEYKRSSTKLYPISLLYNTIKACSADGKLAKEELAAIRKVASELHVSEGTFKEIQEIYKAEDALKKRLGKLCTEREKH